MDRKTRTLFFVLAAAVIVVAVLASFAISLFGQNSHEINLPDLSEGDAAISPGNGEDGSYIRVEITPETVQSVIASLVRPLSYYREISIELWAGEEMSSLTTAQVWVDDGWIRSDVTAPDGMVQYNLVGDGTHWIWYDGSEEFISLPADETAADLVQRIPTYEDVLELPQEAITSTGYETFGGVDCVFVEVAQRELGSCERYWIAVTNGLLVAAEREKDSLVVYRMTALSTQSPAPQDSSFALPDGTVLHTVGKEAGGE